jgi:hypothetical protein
VEALSLLAVNLSPGKVVTEVLDVWIADCPSVKRGKRRRQRRVSKINWPKVDIIGSEGRYDG